MAVVGKIVKAAKKLADEWDEAAWLKENPEPPGTKRSNPEKKRWLEKRHYYRNRQKKLDRVRERYENKSGEIKAVERQRYQDNRERLLEGKREYYKNNKQSVIANANKRKADQLQRTPEYSDSDAIKRVYEQAGLLSEATGTTHHVDHVIPLRGENVSGLHVPGNLMIVPDNLNLSKSNKFTPGDDPMRFNDVAQQNITEQNAKGLLPGLLAGGVGLGALSQSEESEAGPLTAAAKALLDRNFTEPAVRSATDMANAYKSREALTLMDIDEFLNLAQKGYAPDKFDALKNVEKFDEVPFLSIDYRDGADGVAHVTGHEGRHRAMTLKDRGETQIPVRMRSNIRWDQQETPNFDYVEDWPSLLASQNEGITSPFPFKRGDSNLLDSSDLALRSKYTPPKKAEPKPDSYDTEILADLLDEFNFEKGNADPRLLAGTAAGTAGLLAAPVLMKDGIFQHTASETPIVDRKEPVRNQSGLLEDVTNFGDEVFKSVRHAAGPLADVFMPYEGVNNYLKTVNDADKQPTWWDRLGILDF